MRRQVRNYDRWLMNSPKWTVTLLLVLVLAACNRQSHFAPLPTGTIHTWDRFFDVKAVGPKQALIAGYGGKLLETTDGGLSFKRFDTKTDRALYGIAAIRDQIWVVGQDGLIIGSDDGGKSWRKQDSAIPESLFSIAFVNEMHGFAVGDRSVIVETTDGGRTWQARKIAASFDSDQPDLAVAMQDPIFYDIRFINTQVGWISGEFGRLLKTIDGGESWTEQQGSLMSAESGIDDPMDLPTFFGVTPVSEQEVYAAGINGKIVRTTDGGESWKFELLGLDLPLLDPIYRVAVTPGGTRWAVGAAGVVLRAPPGQETWKRVNVGSGVHTWIRSIDFSDAQNGWMAGGFGTILRTEDGGQTWRKCSG